MARNYEDSVCGGILGHLIGDALGVPYEFTDPKIKPLPSYDQIEFEPPAGFDRAHKGVKPGTWSDDGSQMLCLLESLLANKGKFYFSDLEGRLIHWLYDNYMAVDGEVFDCGMQTMVALSQAKRLHKPVIDPRSVDGEASNGNGSLMRVLPLGLLEIPDDDLIHWSMQQSKVTHGHIRSQMCCAFYALWAKNAIHMINVDDAWEWAARCLKLKYPKGTLASLEIEAILDYDRHEGKGYAVDCLHSARYANKQLSYEAVVREAILLGHDTDTTAAVAGGIAGIRFGVEGIPKRWRDQLRGKEILDPVMERLGCYLFVNQRGEGHGESFTERSVC